VLYLATARDKFQNIRHCSVAVDGMRAGGEEILQLAFFSLAHQVGCWMLVQAPLTRKL
jgi:hypothetical protein